MDNLFLIQTIFNFIENILYYTILNLLDHTKKLFKPDNNLKENLSPQNTASYFNPIFYNEAKR